MCELESTPQALSVATNYKIKLGWAHEKVCDSSHFVDSLSLRSQSNKYTYARDHQIHSMYKNLSLGTQIITIIQSLNTIKRFFGIFLNSIIFSHGFEDI